MKRTWFTSDTHFGHANILKHCNRPFSSAAEMDGEMLARWNAVVRPEDIVWHLGDFAFRNARSPSDYLRRLHGTKHLIVGNHDHQATLSAPEWASVERLAEVTVDGIRIVMCHYGMRVWPRSHHGSLMLYGHSHGNLPGDRQSLDVGVDVWDYRPVGLDQIRERLATLPERRPPDHHGRGGEP